MRPIPEASNERGGRSSSEEGGGGGGCPRRRTMRRRRRRGTMISAAATAAVLATSSASIRAAAASDVGTAAAAGAPVVDESSDRSLRDHWGEESGNYEWSAEGEAQATRNSFRHDPIFDNDNAEPDDRMYAMAQSYSCATRQGARTCSDDDDCRDEYGQYGGDSNCGFAFCQSDTGTCMYNAWRSGEGCESTFRTCRKDWDENGKANHGACDRGPSGVRGVEGLCIGWSRNECVYAWCPPSSSATATVVSAMGDDVSEAPPAPPAATTTTPPPPEEDPPVDEIREYECTVDLIGSPRPLYGELEMERLIASLSTCTTKVHPLAVVESVEVMGQEYVPGQGDGGGDVYGGRERRSARRLGKKRRTRAKAKHRYCKRCRNNDPASDRRRRHLEHDEGETTTTLTFDDCMLSLLLAGVTHDREELGALWGVDEVETVCAEAAQQQDPNAASGTTIMPLGDHPIVHTHDDGTGTANQDPSAGGRSVNDDDDEEVFCETTFTGPDVVPMLSQRELLYFDWCFLKVYNRLHYDPTDSDNSEMMVGSVVLEQDPDFAVVDNPLYADGDAIRRGRKLAGKKSRTKSSVRRCKRCRKKNDELPGADRRQRRRRNDDSSGRQLATPPDWTKFSPLLAKCLHEGRDPERPDRPYPAFASRLLVTETTCDPTAAEISAQAATAEAEAALQAKRIDAERAFEEGQKREAESFREYCAAEEAKFRRELEEKKRTFALKQETDRLEFLADWEAKEKQREGV